VHPSALILAIDLNPMKFDIRIPKEKGEEIEVALRGFFRT
jgi:hypothetical protein